MVHYSKKSESNVCVFSGLKLTSSVQILQKKFSLYFPLRRTCNIVQWRKKKNATFFWRTGFCIFGKSRELRLGEATEDACDLPHKTRKHNLVSISSKRNSV